MYIHPGSSSVLYMNMDIMHVNNEINVPVEGKNTVLSLLLNCSELLKHLFCKAKSGLYMIAVITLGSFRRQGDKTWGVEGMVGRWRQCLGVLAPPDDDWVPPPLSSILGSGSLHLLIPEDALKAFFRETLVDIHHLLVHDGAKVVMKFLLNINTRLLMQLLSLHLAQFLLWYLEWHVEMPGVNVL